MRLSQEIKWVINLSVYMYKFHLRKLVNTFVYYLERLYLEDIDKQIVYDEDIWLASTLSGFLLMSSFSSSSVHWNYLHNMYNIMFPEFLPEHFLSSPLYSPIL